MLRLDKVIKPWKESAALNDHINLYGFWNETTFLTKSGDVGHGPQYFRRGLRES
jgi:type IV secretion system protein TrbE